LHGKMKQTKTETYTGDAICQGQGYDDMRRDWYMPGMIHTVRICRVWLHAKTSHSLSLIHII